MFKNAFFLSASNVATALIGLLRNILVARLISVEDFGIAATFAITMSLVEMASNAGFDRLLVQARDAEETQLQNTLQFLQMVRGVGGALVLLAAADVVAFLFNQPDEVWAYRLLALVPLMRGFIHLDIFRLQREMKFAPTITVELGSIALSTAAVVPLAMIYHDFRVMLFVILLQQAIYTGLTYLVARKSFRPRWDASLTKRALDFGWPLLINGLLLFAAFYGDRFIVGNAVGLTELGWFSAAFALTLAPTQVVAKTLNSFLLPQLSKVQEAIDDFRHLYAVSVEAALLVGVSLVLFFTALGPWFITFLYGAKYEAATGLIIWLAIMQGVRIGKAGPAIVATAKAETKNPLYANLIRIACLPLAWLAALQGQGLYVVVAIAIVAEVIGLLVSILLLRTRLQLPLQRVLPSLGLSLAALIWAGGSSMFDTGDLTSMLLIRVAPIAIAVIFLIGLMKDLRLFVSGKFLRPRVNA